MMTRTAAMIGGLVVAVAAALVPPPQQMLKSPKALYGAAVIKALAGDADSALRLLQRSSEPAAEKPAMKTASTCREAKRG
jgi:hypothetical protein